MALGPKCHSKIGAIPSGPNAFEVLMFLIADLTCSSKMWSSSVCRSAWARIMDFLMALYELLYHKLCVF